MNVILVSFRCPTIVDLLQSYSSVVQIVFCCNLHFRAVSALLPAPFLYHIYMYNRSHLSLTLSCLSVKTQQPVLIAAIYVLLVIIKIPHCIHVIINIPHYIIKYFKLFIFIDYYKLPKDLCWTMNSW